VTGDRGNDAGHGVVNPVDNTRIAAAGGNSLYFGSTGAAGGTADNKYNFPGGAHGTIVSNPISLEGLHGGRSADAVLLVLHGDGT
jgi:hypothetical protein